MRTQSVPFLPLLSARALLASVLVFCAVPARAVGPVVSNVRAAQRPGAKLVDVYYDLADPDSPKVTVSVEVSDNGGLTYQVPASSFSGDGYGAGVTPGKNKHIVWDAGRDWDKKFSSNMRFRVTANDNGPPPTIPGFSWIPPGTFLMGSPASEQDRYDNEGPQTVVTLTQGFWMSQYLVTQAQYQDVMGSNPAYFGGDPRRPVERVTWNDATNYCGVLTARERLAGRLPAGYVYRLPTEAEWEYACRAGTMTRFSFGDDPGYSQLGTYAWFAANSSNQTHPVGEKQPNPWGLYDMHGNVWEWCLDRYGSYPGGAVADPRGPATGSDRVIRGGSWGYDGRFCRSAYRYDVSPDYRSISVGFRPVLAPGQP